MTLRTVLAASVVAAALLMAPTRTDAQAPGEPRYDNVVSANPFGESFSSCSTRNTSGS
jgi:hypothetical protein